MDRLLFGEQEPGGQGAGEGSRAGVLAEPVNESGHRPVMLDIDAATALGKSSGQDSWRV